MTRTSESSLIVDITEVTAPTEREVKVSFNRIDGFFWMSVHRSIV